MAEKPRAWSGGLLLAVNQPGALSLHDGTALHMRIASRRMGQRYILAHDLGTSGNKATLFDESGTLVASAFSPYPTDFPHPNWAEQNADDWWRAVCASSQELLARSAVAPDAIAAVGFDGMMMGCLPVDEQGAPLRTCIIWADQRAQDEARWMEQRCGSDRLYRKTGQRPNASYVAPKILWVRNHQPEIYARTHKFLQPKDYAAWKLSGVFATDFSDASGTMLFDLNDRAWDAALLAEMDIAPDKMPNAYTSATVIGEVTPQAAAETGLAAGTPVVIGGGDGAMAGAGAGVIEPGSAYCVVGTSAWVSVSTEAPMVDPQQRIMTFHHVHPDRYAPMGVMQMAGGSRNWAWQTLGGDPDLDLDEAAARVPAGSRGLVYLPYLMGERSPWWNPLARGAYIGLSMQHGKPEMARATLEGVAMGLRQILEVLREQIDTIDCIRLIGGGGKSSVWQHMLADAFGLPIHLLHLSGEANSWGAAVTAGVAVNLYDWSLAAERTQVTQVIDPDPATSARYADLAVIYEDLYRALVPGFDDLAAFNRKYD